MKNQKLSISWRIWALTWVIVLAAISSLIVYWATWQTNQVKNCYENKTEARCKADTSWCYWYDEVCHDSENPIELKDSPFDEYKTERIDNILSWEKWDQLMDLLNRVDELTVPAGAIMAFDSKDWCPDGWEEWTQGNWKFLMWWVPSQVLMSWWNNKIRLSIDQLPTHNFRVMFHLHNIWENADDRYLPIPMDYSINREYREGERMVDNKWNYVPDATTDETNRFYDYYDYVKTDSVGKNDLIDITNPYVRVVFCKKTNNKTKVDAVCSSNKFECEQWVLDTDSIEGGGHLDYQSKWICRWNNWGSDKYCIKCSSPDYSIRNPWKQNQQCYLNWKCYVGSDRQEILQTKCAAWKKTDPLVQYDVDYVRNWTRWNCEWIWSWASTDYCLLCDPGYPYLYKGKSNIRDGERSNRVCGSSKQDNWTYNTENLYWYWHSVWVFHYVPTHGEDTFPRDLVDWSYSLEI